MKLFSVIIAMLLMAAFEAFLNSSSKLRISAFVRPVLRSEAGTDDCLRDIRNAMCRIQSLQTKGSPPIKINVKVDSSSIAGAGKGIFALQNIKAGTLIGLYPVHAIGIDYGDDTSVCVASTAEDQQNFDNDSAGSTYIQYLIGSRRLGDAEFGSDCLFVDVNPNRPVREGWISHYINDGATVTSNSEKGMLDYYAASRTRKNCVTVPFGPSPILATFTTRKVKKGDELFTSYGCMYWLEALLEDGEICADISEAVQLQVKLSAQDLFDAMILARKTYCNLLAELEEAFLKLGQIE